jgi:hypothetical protein
VAARSLTIPPASTRTSPADQAVPVQIVRPVLPPQPRQPARSSLVRPGRSPASVSACVTHARTEEAQAELLADHPQGS